MTSNHFASLQVNNYDPVEIIIHDSLSPHETARNSPEILINASHAPIMENDQESDIKSIEAYN